MRDKAGREAVRTRGKRIFARVLLALLCALLLPTAPARAEGGYWEQVNFTETAEDYQNAFGMYTESLSTTVRLEIPKPWTNQTEATLTLSYNYNARTAISYRWVEDAPTAAPTVAPTPRPTSAPTTRPDEPDDFDPDDYEPYYPDEDEGGGIPPVLLIVAVPVVGGGVALLLLLRKKPRIVNTAPEVYDWRGNRIDDYAIGEKMQEDFRRENREGRAADAARREAEYARDARHRAEQDRMEDELIRISQRLSTTTRDAAWELNKIVRKQIDASLSGKDIDPARMAKIQETFGKLVKGKIIGQDDIPPMPTDAQLYIRAYEDAFEEVCRNETATAVAVRSISGVLSGGASDKVFQAGKAVYRMRDYVDKGGDSALGAAGYALFGEARDRVVGEVSDKVMLEFKPLIGTEKGDLIYSQVKRYVRQYINFMDKGTVDSNDKALRFFRWATE